MEVIPVSEHNRRCGKEVSKEGRKEGMDELNTRGARTVLTTTAMLEAFLPSAPFLLVVEITARMTTAATQTNSTAMVMGFRIHDRRGAPDSSVW